MLTIDYSHQTIHNAGLLVDTIVGAIEIPLHALKTFVVYTYPLYGFIII